MGIKGFWNIIGQCPKKQGLLKHFLIGFTAIEVLVNYKKNSEGRGSLWFIILPIFLIETAGSVTT